MKKIIQILVLILMLLFTTNSQAAAAWYSGKVSRVAFIGADGSFLVTFKGTALHDCRHKYAYFDATKIGEGRMKGAFWSYYGNSN